MTLVTPNWPLERKIFRIRFLLTALFIIIHLTGIFRISWTLFWMYAAVGALLLPIIRLGIARQWPLLPTFNFFSDQFVTIFLLSASGGAAGPYVFLIYLHVVSAIVFLRQVRAVFTVAAIQVGLLFLSSLVILLAGGNPSWASAVVHSLGLLIIASSLAQPTSDLYRDAERDALTGALNRRSGVRELERWLGAGQPFSLLFADMKKFKRINDTFGHNIGDEVLKSVASLILESVRDDDLLIRYGGDEFLVATKGEPEPITERLSVALAYPVGTSAGSVGVDIDFGVSHFPEDAATLSELISAADQSMFRAKRDSRQRDLSQTPV